MTSTASFDRSAFATRMRAGGWWADRTVDSLFANAVAQHATKDAIVAYRADQPPGTPPQRLTYGALGKHVARAAGALRALGVGTGDIVAVQLPNWWEFAVVALAASRIGAIVNPLMPIFRERELGFMLRFSEAKVLIIPKVFRGFDHEVMAAALRPTLPNLAHVIVVDGHGGNEFSRMLLAGDVDVPPPARADDAALSPDDVAVLMFTSGTTGEPKGVMHSANSLVACIHGLAGRLGTTQHDVMLGCSPLGHMTGYAAVLLKGMCLGATVVLQDVWDPKAGIAIMDAENVTHTAAATPFLTDICDAVAAGGPKPRLKTFLCGGAPIPPVMIERAAREIGLNVSSLWGMTEALAGTLTEPQRAHQKSSSTDGRPLAGVECMIADASGKPQPHGETGRLLVRGAQMFIGYFKRPDIATFDAEGWFDTGDLAYADTEGYIRINGRTKDVLIRGGENVPVAEIENLLFAHPAIAAAALVGIPDQRLGERGCVFVSLKPGASFDLAALQAFMADSKVAKQYWPERVEIEPNLPRTPSGKIQKFALRERAKAFSGA